MRDLYKSVEKHLHTIHAFHTEPGDLSEDNFDCSVKYIVDALPNLSIGQLRLVVIELRTIHQCSFREQKLVDSLKKLINDVENFIQQQ